VPWPLRVLVAAVVLGLALGLALWTYDAGKHFAGFDRDLNAEIVRLHDQMAALASDRDRLAAADNAAESRLAIERAAKDRLGAQMRSLELENARLKDDVAFFQSLSANGPVVGLAIRRLQVEHDSLPQQMHYRMLVIQGGKPEHDFHGELELILSLQQGGKTAIISLPENTPGTDAKSFQVGFRFFTRLEGTFRVPEGAVLKQVEARVLENGSVRAQATVMVS